MADTQGFHQDLNAALAIAFQDAGDRFELDRHGMVTIDFAGLGEVVLQALPEAGTALLSVAVCPIDPLDTAVLRRALEVNLFKVAPAGAYLAFDPVQSVLTLCQSTGPGICQPDGLTSLLGEFVAGIATVRALVLAPAQDPNGQMPFAADVSEIIING
jgi:hypothetical protein